MTQHSPGTVWRRTATPRWLAENRAALEAVTHGAQAIVEQPHRAHLAIEYFCARRGKAHRLQRQFGGTLSAVPADWLEVCARAQIHPPIRVGRRLVVVAEPDENNRHALVIPAGSAFGTGDHATTAMSLRLLESYSRGLAPGWRALDAGTGSGILALATRRFGAGAVLAIDNDPRAIRTAKANAALNRIIGVQFQKGDVLKPIGGQRFDLITANLYSELLIAALPRLTAQLERGGPVIFSGILRAQEGDVIRAMLHHGLTILKTRRRGKWIAILANDGHP